MNEHIEKETDIINQICFKNILFSKQLLIFCLVFFWYEIELNLFENLYLFLISLKIIQEFLLSINVVLKQHWFVNHVFDQCVMWNHEYDLIDIIWISEKYTFFWIFHNELKCFWTDAVWLKKWIEIMFKCWFNEEYFKMIAEKIIVIWISAQDNSRKNAD